MKLKSLMLLLAIASGAVSAQEAVITLRATVTGNQEQPRVMYIVPWQQPGATEFDTSPTYTAAADLFSEIDREEFLRDLNYRRLLAGPGDNSENDY